MMKKHPDPRTVIGILLGFALCVGMLFAGPAPSAFAEPPCGHPGEPPCGTTTSDGWQYYYDEASGTFKQRPGDAPVNRTPTWYYQSRDAKPLILAVCAVIRIFIPGFSCEGWLVCKTKDTGEAGFWFLEYRRVNPVVWQTLTDEEKENEPYEGYEDWALDSPGITCHGPARTITKEEIWRHAQQYFEDHAPDPDFKVRPDKKAIVNFPIILRAKDLPPYEHDITQPLPGRLWAKPAYTWKFSEGPDVTGSGRDYDGTDPRSNPGYYLTKTFKSKGPQTITLVVHWEAWIRVGNNNPVQLRDLTREYPSALTLVSSRAVLGGGN